MACIRVTRDALTGRPFRWNSTCVVRTRDGRQWIVPQRITAVGADWLHPNRVPAPLLAELNPNPQQES